MILFGSSLSFLCWYFLSHFLNLVFPFCILLIVQLFLIHRAIQGAAFKSHIIKFVTENLMYLESE